jgi:pyruvate/2-oxoglutarate/acetoin dehydrogenase E1 component
MNPDANFSCGQAINQALADAMDADDRVVLLGEDIGPPGGPFGVTAGLHDRFGSERVIDFPVSEASLVGTALGLALGGYKPVVEIMFMDFCTLAMDGLVNQSAKTHYMFGGQNSVPMVVRMPHGGGMSAGAQHSQCLEAWFAHIPGLLVVCPSNPIDAYELMRGAINNPNPVIFVEHKSLYATKQTFPLEHPTSKFNEARIIRNGADVTVVTYGAAVHWALECAEQIATDGINVEIIDLRSIQPWDEELVLASVAKTHRLVVFHEGVEQFGIGAEIAARVADRGFSELHAPIRRVGAPFVPVPYAPSLEERYRPNSTDLGTAIREQLSFT